MFEISRPQHFWASALEKTIAKESAKDRATTLAKELGLKFSRRIAGVYEVAHFILPLLDTDFMHGHGDTKKGLSLGDSYLKAAEHFGCDERTIETIWSEYKKVSNHNEMVRLLEASMGRYRRRRFRVDYKVQTSFKVVQYQHYMLERVRRFHYRH
ncbi:MAG: hypothetical protein U5M23_03130 [Marinagarivorans sp.]|nr:hypothetical protein [Marinagarivorans sp.]